MSGKVKIKRTTTAGKIPTTSDISDGELALNTNDTLLFINSNGSIIEIELSKWSIKTANYSANNGDSIIADTYAGSFTITLPPSPSTFSKVRIKDSRGSFATNNLTVARNGSNIVALAEDLILDVNHADITLVYQDTTVGWTI